MDVIEKIVDDLRDRDVVNVKLVAFDEEQQQVERALELWQFYLVS
jgi:hypothetical protein